MSVKSAVAAGAAVTVTVADPFELSQTMVGRVLATHRPAQGALPERILVHVDRPLIWRGASYAALALAPRYGSGLLDELSLGRPVDCNGIGLDVDARDLPAPWGADDWRGGLAIIATVQAGAPHAGFRR